MLQGNELNQLNKNNSMLGIVDRDRDISQPKKIYNYTNQVAEIGSISLCKHERYDLMLIIIDDEMEDFIINRGNFNNFLEKHNIPKDKKSLKRNRKRLEPALEKLIDGLIKEEEEEFIALKKWITDFFKKI